MAISNGVGEIPKECWGAVVVSSQGCIAGNLTKIRDRRMKDPISTLRSRKSKYRNVVSIGRGIAAFRPFNNPCRPGRCFDQAQCHRSVFE